MIVANNLWGISTVPQLRPFCGIDFSTKNPQNFSFVLRRYPSFCANSNNRKTSATVCCNSTNGSGVVVGSSLEWDWNRWNRHFSEIEQAESFASVLKFQLEDAIENEDFQEAAKLKMAIKEAMSKDNVAEIMSELKKAIDEERYHDASRLCRYTGSGLVGWWVGYSTDSDDSFGRLVRITPGVGRFVGRSYTPRQLVTASPGTPLFEVFVVKDAEERYVMQVVFLRQAKGSSSNSTSLSFKSAKVPSTSESEDPSHPEVQESGAKAEKSEEKGMDIEGATEEGIKSVINFLTDKIPGLKAMMHGDTNLVSYPVSETIRGRKQYRNASETFLKRP